MILTLFIKDLIWLFENQFSKFNSTPVSYWRMDSPPPLISRLFFIQHDLHENKNIILSNLERLDEVEPPNQGNEQGDWLCWANKIIYILKKISFQAVSSSRHKRHLAESRETGRSFASIFATSFVIVRAVRGRSTGGQGGDGRRDRPSPRWEPQEELWEGAQRVRGC